MVDSPALTGKDKFVEAWVKFRTSFMYVYAFTAIITIWIFLNKSGVLVFDNGDLTYLNLLISVATELQSIVLLIYIGRMALLDHRRDVEMAENVKALMNKVDSLLPALEKDVDKVIEGVVSKLEEEVEGQFSDLQQVRDFALVHK